MLLVFPAQGPVAESLGRVVVPDNSSDEHTPYPLYACRMCGQVQDAPGRCENEEHAPAERVEIPGRLGDPDGEMAKALEGVRREYDTFEGALEAQSTFHNTIVTEGLLDLLAPPDGIERLTPAGRDAVERLLMFYVAVTQWDDEGGITWFPQEGAPRGAWSAFVIEPES